MLRRFLPLIVIVIAVAATIATGYVYLGPSFPAHDNVKPSVTVISIPKGSYIHPAGFNVTQLLTNTYTYPFNVTVTIGVNNTIRWVNDDTVDHTVSAFTAPVGGLMFNSGLIGPGKTFTATLTVAGVYKYTCSWHQWLAGQVTVKLA
jgi:Copper binding proteins, plastocyanin/azurin family